jgi:TrmH family RNA methyltransferase
LIVPLSQLDHVQIVLVGTTHPGNIGATARAMKNMGLSRLVLVDPLRFPAAEATARASGAVDILHQAHCVATLADALRDSVLVFGTSARQRSITWPVLTPRACAAQALQTAAPVSLVFGREHSGLSNEELDLCHYLIQIPTNADYASLNLAAAVQVLCYELRLTALAETAPPPADLAPLDRPVSAQEMQLFYEHLQQTLIDLAFLNPAQPGQLMRRLHRLFNRAQPTHSEMNILRGILTAAQRKDR